MKLRKNQIISPKNFALSSLGNQKYPPSYWEISQEEMKQARFYHASALVSGGTYELELEYIMYLCGTQVHEEQLFL